VAVDLGDDREAQDALQESASLSEALKLPWGLAQGQHNLGWLALARGEYTRARECFEASLAHDRSTGHQKDIGADQLGLAGVAIQTGDHSEAWRLYASALALYRGIGYQRGAAMALVGLGEATLANDDPASAQVYLHEALLTALRIRALPWVLASLVGMAALWVQAGQAEKAVELLTFCLYHSASNRRSQNQAARLLSRLEGELPAAQVAAAEERGRRMALDPQAALVLARQLSSAAEAQPGPVGA
jgi:tetratricopeptide (TPR) repeat protein